MSAPAAQPAALGGGARKVNDNGINAIDWGAVNAQLRNTAAGLNLLGSVNGSQCYTAANLGVR